MPVLTSPAFLLAVALLVLNDWVLKPAVGNWWTGKLSDFAGLFAFATFWAALLPRRRPAVFALTAVGFLIWKSPISGPPLAAWNSLGVWPLARVVDYTDWIALGALVPAYWYTARGATEPRTRGTRRLMRRLGAVAAGGVAIVAFSATSVAYRHPFPDSLSYVVPGSIDVVRLALDSLGYRPEDVRRGRSDSVAADTVTLHVRHPPERWVAVRVEVRDERPGEARLRLVYMWPLAEGPRPSTETLDRAFRTQVVEPLREWLARTARAPR